MPTDAPTRAELEAEIQALTERLNAAEFHINLLADQAGVDRSGQWWGG